MEVAYADYSRPFADRTSIGILLTDSLSLYLRDDLSYNGAYQALFRLKEECFGGIILFNKPQGGFISEEYLSKKGFMVQNILRAAKELSLVVLIHCPKSHRDFLGVTHECLNLNGLTMYSISGYHQYFVQLIPYRTVSQ